MPGTNQPSQLVGSQRTGTTVGESSLIGVQVVIDLVPKISWGGVCFSNETEHLKNKHISILLKIYSLGTEGGK